MKKLLIILTIVVAATAFKCGGSSGGGTDVPNGGVAISRDVLQRTASGARVWSKYGIVQSQIDDIERGLIDRANIARQDGHTLGLNVDLYDVLIPLLPCVQSPIQRVWSFKVRADNYDGTEYDQDPRPGIGVVFASEMIVNFNGTMVVCPQVGYEASGNGLDHIALGLNPNTYPDGLNYFYATLTHSNGQGHPLLPRGDRFAESFVKTELPEPKEFSRTEAEKIAKEFGVKISDKDSAVRLVFLKPVK